MLSTAPSPVPTGLSEPIRGRHWQLQEAMKIAVPALIDSLTDDDKRDLSNAIYSSMETSG